MPYVGPGDIKKITNLEQGHCLIIGQIAESRPVVVHVRDIKTRRAKSRNYEEMIGLAEIKPPKEDIEETPPKEVSTIEIQNIVSGKAKIQVKNHGASVDIVAKCPDCGQDMEYNQQQKMIVCKNQRCTVIGIKNGKVLRSAVAPTP